MKALIDKMIIKSMLLGLLISCLSAVLGFVFTALGNKETAQIFLGIYLLSISVSLVAFGLGVVMTKYEEGKIQ